MSINQCAMLTGSQGWSANQ